MTRAYMWLALALAAVGHGFLWTGLVNRLHGWGGPRWLVKSITVLLVVAFAAIPLLIIRQHGLRLTSGLPPSAERSMASCYLWLCAAIGGASMLVKPWIESHRYDASVLRQWTPELRDVARTLGRKPLVGPLANLLGALPFNEALTLSIDRKRLAIPRLPVELEGLAIAQLSDLHMTGRLDKSYYDYLVRQVNDLRPDVILLTGDIVEHEPCWPWLADTIGQLCAPLGVFFILGNHDALIDAEHTRKLLIDAGLTDVGGRALRADWNGAAVTIVGNELPWIPPAPDFAPPARIAESEFRLFLCHSPDQFGYCALHDADLALAGHTHGGQIQIPLWGVIVSPSLYGTRYACGVFRRGSTVLHVSRGVSSETPLRWRCPPEIALLKLTAAADREKDA